MKTKNWSNDVSSIDVFLWHRKGNEPCSGCVDDMNTLAKQFDATVNVYFRDRQGALRVQKYFGNG
jgi:hypothetical protein